jgi:very-short-patch-repair endonuclease
LFLASPAAFASPAGGRGAQPPKAAERRGWRTHRGLEPGTVARYEGVMATHRDPWLIVRAKQLRHHQTNAETVLWHRLRAGRLAGYRFRRQHPIGPYVVDFVCLEAKLVIEVDGPTHDDRQRDQRRDRDLASRGYSTLRFWNNDLYENIDGVIEMILNQLVPPSP